MPSRFAGKISLAPALTANWLIIMAGVATVAYGSAAARAADEDNSTSEQGASKWSIIIGGGGAYVLDYEGSDDYELQPFPFASVVYDDFVFLSGPSFGSICSTMRASRQGRSPATASGATKTTTMRWTGSAAMKGSSPRRLRVSLFR